MEAMPLWLLFSLCCNISDDSAWPKPKQDIVSEAETRPSSSVMDYDIHRKWMDFFRSHGWFSISDDKKQLLVLSYSAVFFLQFRFCSLFNHNNSTFLNESEDQHPLSQVHLRIFHVSGVSTPVPPQLTGNAGNLTIRGNGDYFGAQIGAGVDQTLIHNFCIFV